MTKTEEKEISSAFDVTQVQVFKEGPFTGKMLAKASIVLND